VPVDAVKSMLLPIIIPFNLIKAGINATVTFIILQPLRRFVVKRPIKEQTDVQSSTDINS
jgi:riboflavin transporter FmnP